MASRTIGRNPARPATFGARAAAGALLPLFALAFASLDGAVLSAAARALSAFGAR